MRRHVVVALLVVAAMLASCRSGTHSVGPDVHTLGPSFATPGVPVEPGPAAALLSCGGGRVVATTIDHDDTARETRPPSEQAAAFAVARAGAFAGRRTVVFESGERVDIAFADPAGRVTAALSYHHDGDLGWRLREAVNCP